MEGQSSLQQRDMIRVPHSPEQLRRASNLAHWAVGMVMAVAAVLALNEAFLGGSRSLRLAWSGMVFVLGVLFSLFLLFHHGLRQLPAWLADLAEDPQQRQHLLMALLLTIGGYVEFAHAKRWTTALIWHYVWPGVLLLIGLMFVFHAQHGRHDAVSKAVRFHRMLGVALLAAGLLAGAHAYQRLVILGYLWPVALLVAAVLLIAYREPEGAWEDTGHVPHG